VAATGAGAAATRPAPATTPPPVYPEPPPERGLARDQNGAMLAVNRPKGVQQPAITPNADFYVVTKNAAGDPRLEARDWRLVIDGAVNHPVQVDYLTLRRLPSVSVYKSLECISNLVAKCELAAFGCDLISTAKWTGARLSDVLGLAGGLKTGVVTIVAFGADEYSSALPAAVASDPETLLAFAMNDTVLPREHGFPVRLLVPDRYGYKNTKWLVNLKATPQPYLDWYSQRNWTPEGIVKTMSRIDVPAPGAIIPAGANRIAGIAYGGARGISKVEFSADAGKTWEVAALEPALGNDTFVRWSGAFTAARGASIELVARATDGTGRLQIEQFSLPQPDGGAGWNSITVRSP
jgi:sulfite oxidase